MSTKPIDYDALAKQYGATSSAVDYDALAKQHGAISSTAPAQAAQPSATSRFLGGAVDEAGGLIKGAWDTLTGPTVALGKTAWKGVTGNLTASDVADLMQKANPGYVANQLVADPTLQKGASAVQAFKSGDPIKGTLGALATINPLAPDVTKTYEQAMSGDTAGAAGHGAVQIGSLVAGQAIGKLAPKLTGNLRPAGAQASVIPEAAQLPKAAIDGAERVFRAAAPVGSDPMFRRAVYTAAGDLAEVNQTVKLAEAKGGIVNPDLRVRATVNAINDHLTQMYQQERAPQIARNAEAPVVMQLSGDALEGLQNIAKNGSTEQVRALATQALTEKALPLAQVDELARVVNREMSPMRGLTPQELAQVEGGSRKLAAAKSLDAELGTKIETELTNRGEPSIKPYEQRYAALSEVRDQLQKRMNMTELQRRSPITMAADVVRGVRNPMAGASQAATAKVNIGAELQKGLQQLSDSGIKPKRAVGTGRPPVKGLLTPGSIQLGSQVEPIGDTSPAPPVLQSTRPSAWRGYSQPSFLAPNNTLR